MEAAPEEPKRRRLVRPPPPPPPDAEPEMGPPGLPNGGPDTAPPSPEADGGPSPATASESDSSTSASDGDAFAAGPPRLTIRPIPEPPRPPIEKMTIRINKPEEPPEPEAAAEAPNPPGPLKMTFKIGRPRDGESPPPPPVQPLVPKLTIKITQDRSTASPERRPNKRPREEDDDDGAETDGRPEDEYVPRLTIKTKGRPEDYTVSSPKRRPFEPPPEHLEHLQRPLTVETAASDRPGGQESPRIILKINKTVQGPTSEIVGDRPPARPPHDNGAAEPDAEPEPVGPIKLKLSREGGTATIVPRDGSPANGPGPAPRPASPDGASPSPSPSPSPPAEPSPEREPIKKMTIRLADADRRTPEREPIKKMTIRLTDADRQTPKRSKRISNYRRPDWSAEPAEAPRGDSPRFDRIDGEASSSQECMIVDELSQDPLDIGAAAEVHFARSPRRSEAPSETEPTPRRGRGRPRKNPVLVTPLLSEERSLRKSSIIRTPAFTRTPRGRGRSRGARRGGQLHNSFNHRPAAVELCPSSPEQTKEADAASDSSDKSRVEGADSDDRSEESDDSDAEPAVSPTPEWIGETPTPTRGRGRGRGSARGVRRGRGARTPRTVRQSNKVPRSGKQSSKFYEEVQLQDPIPPMTPKNAVKNKMAATHASSLELFEEETCMMGDNDASLRTATLIDEESQDSELSSATATGKSKKSRLEIFDAKKTWTAADVVEYDWPPENSGIESVPQTVMIQEQVSLYLGVKSFKRKYPDLYRRPLEPEEKNFLMERNLLSEAMCDLGVTAIDAGEVLDIMFTDFPAKYEEYRQHLRETRDTRTVNRPPPNLPTERSKLETQERAVESASSWNARFNRQRRTMRAAAVDLQTLTVHYPRKPQVVMDPPPNRSHYPVAVLPGQYTDYFKSYTSDELRYFPLNTVLNRINSPARVEVDSPSEESAEDSDGVESSSDGSDSESSEKNFKRRNINPKAKRAVVNDIRRPTSPSMTSLMTPSAEVLRCKLCNGTEHANRRYPSETFIVCASCRKRVHPSCLEMSANVAKCVRQYAWQCPDCKCCARCEDLADDDKMLFCDLCDRGYHIYCVGLKRVPTGRWHCTHCAICRSCGARNPAGLPNAPSTGNPSDQWHHHLKKNNSGQRVYSHTLCGPCARAWRAGRYCSLCERCFMGKKGALKVVICVNCDKTHHKECVRQPGNLDVLNYMCNSCRRGNTPRRHHVTPRKPAARKPLANNIEVTTNQSSNQTSAQTEPLSSMDLSVDSICSTNDSNHRSNFAYDTEESNKPLAETPVKEPSILSRRLTEDTTMRLSNNHIQKDLKTQNDLNSKNCVPDASVLLTKNNLQNSTTDLNNVEPTPFKNKLESNILNAITENDCLNSYKVIPNFLNCSEAKLNDNNKIDMDVQYGNNSENV